MGDAYLFRKSLLSDACYLARMTINNCFSRPVTYVHELRVVSQFL